jgi:C-terminal processing protease CtpA/Prc
LALVVVFLLSGLTFSCKKVLPEPEPKPVDPDPVVIVKDTVKVLPPSIYLEENKWIYKQMKAFYLFEDQLPNEDKTDKYLQPKEYFKSLINPEKDWYSYFKYDKKDVLGFWWGNPHGFGFRYKILDEGSEVLNLLVTLTSNEAPVGKTALKRGDIIKRVNGKEIAMSDIDKLFDNEKVTLSGIAVNGSSFEIDMAKSTYRVDPFKHAQIYDFDNHKIGYFVFSQFLDGIDTDLRNIFGIFKNSNISDLIIDLRFNPGGFTPNAEVFGSLLVHDLKPGTKMFGGKRSAQNNQTSNPTDGDRGWTSETQNINYLKRVFIITSKSTSSSSELVINSLKPFMEVIIVGDQTFGKNVISTIITDETGKFNFVLMPAFSTIENALGKSDYGLTKGFIPDYSVEDNILPLYSLGDLREPLLNKTISVITGKSIENLNYLPKQIVKFKDRFHYYDSMQPFLSK